MTVAVLGASNNPERYSHRALSMLREHGHEVAPVHPSLDSIDGVAVFSSLDAIDVPVDTLTIYVRPALAEPLVGTIISLAPRRVIFNPGTESETLQTALRNADIETENACTLVMLQTGQF